MLAGFFKACLVTLIVLVYYVISKSGWYPVVVDGFSVHQERVNVTFSIVAPVWYENLFLLFHFDPWNGRREQP